MELEGKNLRRERRSVKSIGPTAVSFDLAYVLGLFGVCFIVVFVLWVFYVCLSFVFLKG